MDSNESALLVRERLAGLVVALCCGGLLVFAATLTPASAGIGTHTQTGLPSCGFKVTTGLPCATCGCTTAFAHAADGSLLSALWTQPFGAVLAFIVAMLTLVALWSVWSGMSLMPLGRALASRRAVLTLIGLMLVAWGYKAVTMAAGT